MRSLTTHKNGFPFRCRLCACWFQSPLRTLLSFKVSVVRSDSAPRSLLLSSADLVRFTYTGELAACDLAHAINLGRVARELGMQDASSLCEQQLAAAAQSLNIESINAVLADPVAQQQEQLLARCDAWLLVCVV